MSARDKNNEKDVIYFQRILIYKDFMNMINFSN